MVHPIASVNSNHINSFQVPWLGCWFKSFHENEQLRNAMENMTTPSNHSILIGKKYSSISSNREKKKTAPKNRRIHTQIPCGPKRSTGWWFQPVWKTCSSNWIISPNRSEHKNLWNHHPENIKQFHHDVPVFLKRRTSIIAALPITKNTDSACSHQMQLLETPPSFFVGRLMNKAHYKFS